MNSRYRPHDYATAKDMQDRVEYTISQDRGTGSSGQAEADYSILIKKDIDLAALIQEPRYPTVTEADIWAARATYSAGETPGPEGDERDENDQSEEYVSEEDVDEKDAAQGAPSSLPRKPKRTQQLEEDVGEPHFADDAKLASGPPLKRFKARQDTPSPHFFASMDANSSIRASKGVNKQQGKEPGKQILRSAADEPVQDIKQPALDNEYHILHRVVCSSTHEQCNRRIYLDKPRRVKRGRSHHLRGEHLILDLNDFLQDRPSIIFIVYRDYFCEQGTRYSTPSYSANHTTTKFFREMFSILSYELQNILQRNSKFAPNVEAYKFTEYESHKYYSSPALSTSPSEYSHRFLYHHRDVLDAEAAAARGASPIKVLVSYLESSSNDMYRRCDELFARGVVTPDTLPWLFRPNDVLVSANGPLRTAYVLRQFPTEGSHLDLMCWNWAYDGHRLHRKDTSLTVKTPTCDEARIDQLTVYPLSYAAKETAQEILANGVKFWVLRNPTSVSYEGPDYQGEGIYPDDSRFMVDYQTYKKFHGEADAFRTSGKARPVFDKWPETLSRQDKLSDQQLVLLPRGIHGFHLKEKKWIHLLVDGIRPINWNKAAFEQLVLPKRTKNLIKGLVMVRKQASKDPESAPRIGLGGRHDDIIAGKGSGLIMLLHGGPGTGKTLTAESVAEFAEMPLYNVTCGDIGTSPEAVEKYLNTVLHLGKKWNCVLLLDEADVFLEERSLADLERNSLVSVFLRTLEYYDGILILTSNRVGTFDEAFKSRIQVALHYPPLDAPSRRKIWHNFFNMLRDSSQGNNKEGSGNSLDNLDRTNDIEANIDIDDILANMDQLAGYELNGRQIRNALTTARQLALFEKKALDWDRIEDSIKVATNFNRYIKEVHGHTDEQWCRDNNLR